MTREEVKSVMYVIHNEYPDFMPKNKQMSILKIDTWFEMLQQFSYTEAKQATLNMLGTHTYGMPKISHLMAILKPEMKEQNKGAEFAQRYIDLLGRKGAERMGNQIQKEFGIVGYSVWLQTKDEARELKMDDNNTFKAQVRMIFNSYEERHKNGILQELPYKGSSLKLIDETVANMTKRLEKGNN